tara:strand:- start:76 stop:819 length:744 start_codon:yes stop_codon:yes gene_type:complete
MLSQLRVTIIKLTPTATFNLSRATSSRSFSSFQSNSLRNGKQLFPFISSTTSSNKPPTSSSNKYNISSYRLFSTGTKDDDDADYNKFHEGIEDDDWDEEDFEDSEDFEDGTGLVRPTSSDDLELSYKVNDPNDSLFIDPGEYLDVQRRRVRALGADADYKGPVTREDIMKDKMPGREWHPRLLQYSMSSVTRKGGRVNSFRALVLIGNGRGSAGFGFGKGSNMKVAIEDATMKAYRYSISIPLYENR